MQPHILYGASGRNRTNDTGIFSPLLYRLSYRSIKKKKIATRMRLELTTSAVTGRRSNQLSYRAVDGGNNRTRTYDPLLVRQMLSQLSYAPIKSKRYSLFRCVISPDDYYIISQDFQNVKLFLKKIQKNFYALKIAVYRHNSEFLKRKFQKI